jgi:phage gp46-like protein
MQGTGGWADELADQPPGSNLWNIVRVDDQECVFETVSAHFTQQQILSVEDHAKNRL